MAGTGYAVDAGHRGVCRLRARCCIGLLVPVVLLLWIGWLLSLLAPTSSRAQLLAPIVHDVIPAGPSLEGDKEVLRSHLFSPALTASPVSTALPVFTRSARVTQLALNTTVEVVPKSPARLGGANTSLVFLRIQKTAGTTFER